jgi:cobalt/nickel transport system permease protein
MSSINKSLKQITALEDLARKDSPLHRLSPTVKLIITVIYILIVISFRQENVSGLLMFACFPVLLMFLGEIPFKPLAMRCMLALPFAIFAGISNLVFSRNIVLYIGQFGISVGVISFISLMLKTILTVMVVLLLIATTSMNAMIYAFHSLHFPSILIIQLMMIYRYLSVLLKEASVMYHAYGLRAPKEKGIRFADYGAFLGQLILRSFDRAERIYQAMQCRGFEGRLALSKVSRLGRKDWFILVAVGLLLIVLRVLNVSEMIGSLWI